MVHLSIPAKLRPGSRPSTPGPSRTTTPRPDQQQHPMSTLLLQVAIVQARNLVGKDKSGLSDPFLVVTFNDQKYQTHTVNRSVNPSWNAVFDITLNQNIHSGLLEAVCWDRDRFRKEYLGEFCMNVFELFPEGVSTLDDPTNEPKWTSLSSSRKKAKITGEVQVKCGLADLAQPNASKEELQAAWDKFVASTDYGSSGGLQALIDAPATESVGVGMIRAETDDSEVAQSAEDLDDEMSSSEVDETPEKKEKRSRLRAIRRKIKQPFEFTQGQNDVLGVCFMEVQAARDLPPERNVTRTGYDMDPFVIVSFGKKTFRTRVIRHNLNPVFNERLIFQVMNTEKNYQVSFNVYDRDKMSSNDFVAQALLPVSEIISSAPTPDTETGLFKLPEPWKDPDAGRPKGKRQDSKLSRLGGILSRTNSSTNLLKKGNGKNGGHTPGTVTPSANASTSTVELTRSVSSTSLSDYPDKPELSATTSIPTSAPTSAPTSVPTAAPEDKDLKNYTIPLTMRKASRWEDKHNPELIINAKYVPYAALRQQLWRCLLGQYDADDSGRLTRVEFVTMLDSLGSTLSEETIDRFFKRFQSASSQEQEQPLKEAQEITVEQAVICLEDQLARQSKGPAQKDLTPTGSAPEGDLTVTPPSNPSDLQLSATDSDSGGNGTGLVDHDEKNEEHVIMITECPLCHQPRLNKRSEVDIVTHIATCASQDWRQVDRFVMGGFVTPDQAHRKWYTKVISKITYGGYKLGANSANILVQDRLTGQIQEERMSVYVRLGIRLLYKGLRSGTMEKQKIKQLLRSLSVKQGRKYDNPISAREIKGFVEFHQLNLDEVLLPLEDFKTFNEFFYRKLKPEARPCTAPDNSSIAVSPADCRSVVFNEIDSATKLWIKGKDFNMQRLLGSAYLDEAAKFEGGALGIFRLAPQDYHRFHVPVDGVIGEPKAIEGQYYTVNPMAIRSSLDVYGENVRVIVPIDTEHFGRMMVVCVGAMMVGSTVITAKKGQKVRRTDELGYFKFGGSTIILLFQPGTFVFDDDLVANSKESLETLLRVGQSIGHHPATPQVVSENEKMEHVTEEDLRDAARRIGGSLAP